MQCVAATAPLAVAGRLQQRGAFRSSVQSLQQRRAVCRAASREDDNWEADEAPKPYGLPTSDELKQTLKDFKYDGNLGIPMIAIALALTWLASIFPGHHP